RPGLNRSRKIVGTRAVPARNGRLRSRFPTCRGRGGKTSLYRTLLWQILSGHRARRASNSSRIVEPREMLWSISAGHSSSCRRDINAAQAPLLSEQDLTFEHAFMQSKHLHFTTRG